MPFLRELEIGSMLAKNDFDYGIGLNVNSNGMDIYIASDNQGLILCKAVNLLKAQVKLHKHEIVFWPESAKTSLFWGQHPRPGVYH